MDPWDTDTQISLKLQVGEYTVQLTLSVPLKIDVDQCVQKVIEEHNLPLHLAPSMVLQLRSQLDRDAQALQDRTAAVVMETKDIERVAHGWKELFAKSHVTYAPETPRDDIDQLGPAYYKLVHSPAFDSLLQLEQHYDRAIGEARRQHKVEMGELKAIQDTSVQGLKRLVKRGQANEMELQELMTNHERERAQLRAQWDHDQKERVGLQRKEYREWVLLQDLTTVDDMAKAPASTLTLGRKESSGSEDIQDGREESFTVHLGAQLKTSHNMCLVCRDPLQELSLVGYHLTQAKTLNKLSLYSPSISGAVLLVDLHSPYQDTVGRGFVLLCGRSSELHFDSFADQLAQVRAHGGDLQPGDFYVTRHSNLPGAHVVFHLMVENTECDLTQRAPILGGLRNVLSTASRHGVTLLSLPLFLTYTLPATNTRQWCLSRAEMVLKSVKAFLIECSAWGGLQDSHTLHFVMPPPSGHLFDPISSLLTGVYQVAQPLSLHTLSSL